MAAPSLRDQFEKTKPGDLGIIGDPIEHSLSPLMQNAALDHLWLQTKKPIEEKPVYHRFHVDAEQLEQALNLAKRHRLRGLNVTIPHKESACWLVDSLDDFASDVEAINTIILGADGLKGYNTDGDGFTEALRVDLQFDPKGKKVMVLGAGGTGRVIAFKLAAVAEKVFWWNRNPSRPMLLMEGYVHNKRIVRVAKENEISEALAAADLIVNATSVGLAKGDRLPFDRLKFRKGQAVFDVIYNRETTFLKEARSVGARSAGGLSMLLYQGAKAFEIWTGSPAPVDVMRRVLEQSIKKD